MSAHGQPAQATVPEQDAMVERLTRELDQVRTEFQEFVYTVSHDLRAPLRHINAFAKIIEEDLASPPPDILQHLATIRQSAQLLGQQLDGLTTLSRLGQQPVSLTTVDTLALVGRVVDDLTLQLSPRQIQWQVAPDLPPLVADADLLHQVFTHLLGNACKFSRSRTPAVIQVAWQRLDSGHCHISVQDNGVGFHTKQADQLFKVFGRLHPARDFEGLGLGLVQCRKMLERMGASVEATAEPDAGCRVTLTLPVA